MIRSEYYLFVCFIGQYNHHRGGGGGASGYQSYDNRRGGGGDDYRGFDRSRYNDGGGYNNRESGGGADFHRNRNNDFRKDDRGNGNNSGYMSRDRDNMDMPMTRNNDRGGGMSHHNRVMLNKLFLNILKHFFSELKSLKLKKKMGNCIKITLTLQVYFISNKYHRHWHNGEINAGKISVKG